MARFQKTAPYAGKGQKMLAARYARVIASGGTLPAPTHPSGYVRVGQPGLRKAIYAEEIRLGLGNICPLGTSRHGGSVGHLAKVIEREFTYQS